jgi:Na+:H+ antiporter, NhaA family
MLQKLRQLISSPEEFAAQLVNPFQRFAHNEAASSILLLAAVVTALLWANSPWERAYHSIWEVRVSLAAGPWAISKTVRHWINDGLMAFFFFVVGLEIKRDLVVGELSSLRRAFLPAAAALGGMVVPALIFTLVNWGTPAIHGWGIPVATDIAFALGALAVLGKNLPAGLRAFLSALAIADDIGAVLVIALFYTETISVVHLTAALFFLVALALAHFFWVRWTLIYAILGVGLWIAVVGSGVHATVAGVLVAFFIPAREKYDTDKFIRTVDNLLGEFECEPGGCGRSILLNERHLNTVRSIALAANRAETPLQRLENSILPWVVFVVVPLFALANGGLTLIGMDVTNSITSRLSVGIILGLLVGKPLGICIFSYLSVKAGIASLPSDVTWPQLAGVGMLAGIGFTMSLFIMGLSFGEEVFIVQAKLGILCGSLLSAVLGLAFLHAVSRRIQG